MPTPAPSLPNIGPLTGISTELSTPLVPGTPYHYGDSNVNWYNPSALPRSPYPGQYSPAATPNFKTPPTQQQGLGDLIHNWQNATSKMKLPRNPGAAPQAAVGSYLAPTLQYGLLGAAAVAGAAAISKASDGLKNSQQDASSSRDNLSSLQSKLYASKTGQDRADTIRDQVRRDKEAGVFGGFRFAGGDVKPDKSYVVGENGPEMFVPETKGKVVPKKKVSKEDLAKKMADAQKKPAKENIPEYPANLKRLVEERIKEMIAVKNGKATMRPATALNDELKPENIDMALARLLRSNVGGRYVQWENLTK